MKKKLANLAVIFVSTVVALGLVELLSRVVMPLSPGAKSVGLDGGHIEVAAAFPRFKPGLVFRLVASEFDVRVTINKDGNRLPEADGPPDIVFVGDSFTFGQGLEDEETFAFIFCKELELSCANVGRSGTGTIEQLNILQHYLDTEGWRPSRVKLFVLAMTSAFNEGNDLRDNLSYMERHTSSMEADSKLAPAKEEKGPPHRGVLESLVASRTLVLAYSNLARIVYYSTAGWLRSRFAAGPSSERLQQALDLQKLQFERLNTMAVRYGFQPEIYVVHPMQDIIGGTWPNTMSSLESLIPGTKITGTADLLKKSPQSYYFAYDGHFNSAGSRKVAEFLDAEEKHRR